MIAELIQKKKEIVPKSLVFEVLDGKTIYRKGYREVLNKTKTIEEIMSCSTLQSEIIDYILEQLYLGDVKRDHRIHTNEPGLHLDKRNNLSPDIAIYEKRVLTAEKINKKYATVAPRIVIEVDIEAELEHLSPEEYIFSKTQRFLDFGVERVIWFLSGPKKVFFATPDADWITMNWDKNVEIFPKISVNVGKYLREEGIRADSHQ